MFGKRKAKVMSETATFAIRTQYRTIGDYHIFTSSDVKGLYVAHRDPKKAYENVAIVMKALVEHKTGAECVIEAVAPYSEFLRHIEREHRAPTARTSHPVLEDKTFVVRCPEPCAA